MLLCTVIKKCGSCTKCCDGTLANIVKGHTMFPGKPCFFLEIGGVCNDYDNRPKDPCVDYKCLWLQQPDVPDFIKPENANAIIDIATFKNRKYLRLIKSYEQHSPDILTYAIEYARYNKLPLIWNDSSGNFHHLGDNIFCLEVIESMSKKNYAT